MEDGVEGGGESHRDGAAHVAAEMRQVREGACVSGENSGAEGERKR